MPKQSEEAKLKRRKPANRRGVFTTWRANTWEALLARSHRNVTDALGECSAVSHVERDVTESVLDKSWRPPTGEWALIVTMATQSWATIVASSGTSDALEQLVGEFEGQCLSAGHSDSEGTVYVRVSENSPATSHGCTLLFDFQSDGGAWRDAVREPPAPVEKDEVERAFNRLTETRLVADDLPSNWLEQFDSLPSAHQAVFRHLDAYVPGLYYDLDRFELSAPFGHEDILEHLSCVDLIRFGSIASDEPSPEALAATRELHAGIRSKDLGAVEKAIAAGAWFSTIEGDSSALYMACFELAYEPYEVGAEIIIRLLDAGARAADDWLREGDAYRDTPLARLVGSRPPLSLIEPIVRRLADAGADLDSPSPYPLQLGERPLHVAAKKALLGWVILLLELGANPLATGDDGRTPRQSVEALIATKKEHTEYDEILGLLAKAERAHRNG